MKHFDFVLKNAVYILLLALLGRPGILNAQNMVKNPSFEEFKHCPEAFGCLEKEVVSWYQPTGGSTDYFNSCSPLTFGVSNFIGAQPPFDGQGYAGMYAYAPKDYREYLTAELKAPLERGRKYIFSFQVSLAEESQYGVNEFGILFTNKAMDFQTKGPISVALPSRKKSNRYTRVRNPNFFADKEGWTEVTGIYIADGAEKFMTIGNFRSNAKTRLLDTGKKSKKVAYYYVDMFSVQPVKKDYELDQIYVFENLNFDTDGFRILGKAKDQLSDLAAYLEAHPGYTVSIYGHTDDVGAKEYNRELSQKRAQSVATFLMEKGLSKHRILWRGYGDVNPLVNNKTEANRGKNRRVEFVLSKEKRDYYASGAFQEDQ